MYGKIKAHLANELKAIEEAGLYKKERIIVSPQDALSGWPEEKRY